MFIRIEPRSRFESSLPLVFLDVCDLFCDLCCNLMTTETIVQLIWVISAVSLVVVVLLHSPKGDGIGGIGGQAQLFTSAKSAETTLNRITWTLTILFMGCTVVLSAGWV